MPAWTWVLTDNFLHPIGEILNARERKVQLPLNRIPSASFTIRLDNPLAAYLQSGEGYIKVYRDGQLLFYGPIISLQETGAREGSHISVNAAGAAWMLQKRFAGKSKTGTKFAGAVDRAAIVNSLIAAENTTYGETRIWTSPDLIESLTATGTAYGQFTAKDYVRPSTTYPKVVMAASSLSNYIAGPFKLISEILREVSAGVDGFDWTIIPYDNHAEGATEPEKIGEFRAQPLIGQDRNDAIFEFGDGRNNIERYSRTVNRDGQANRVYHIASAGPDAPGYPTVYATDADSFAEWLRLEDVASADLLELDLRQRFVNEHVRVRAWPRQIIEFDPHIYVPGRMPNFGVDYSLGDNVRARVLYGGQVRLDAHVRVWGAGFDVDDKGVERVSLMLAEEA